MVSQPTPADPGDSPPGRPPSDPPASNPLARTPWRATSTRPIYRNRWIDVREDIVELPDGHTTVYGVVECSECVGVLPFLDRDTVLLVGQYRYVAKGFFWEMPTGGQDAGETRLQAAQRELAEEAGYEAGDHTEFMERRAFPFAEVLAMVARGEIKDAMTIIAVLHAARRRGL